MLAASLPVSLALTFNLHATESNTVLQTDTGFYYPANTSNRGGYYGWLSKNKNFSNKCHLAYDYKKQEGDKVFSIADGTVVTARMNVGGYGGIGKQGGAIVIEHQKQGGSAFYALYGHVKNFKVKEGDFVVGGQHIGDIGPYENAPHLHFGINTSKALLSGYTSKPNPKNCHTEDMRGFVDPGVFLTNEKPARYEFHGAGSIIKTETDCFGCNKDLAKVQATGKKGLVSFQWKYNRANCDFINISASDFGTDELTVGIIAGKWSHRSNDKYYRATLPVSIGHPRAGFNVAAVMMPVEVSSPVTIRAECGTHNPRDTKTEISRNEIGVELTDGHVWNGSGSIISYNTVPSTGYGRVKDIAFVNGSENIGATVFQWQRSSRCQALKIHAKNRDLNESYPSVELAIKGWSEHPNNATKWFVTLPYTLNIGMDGRYYVISAKLASSTSNPADYIYADCL
jgi:hypothetical protein